MESTLPAGAPKPVLKKEGRTTMSILRRLKEHLTQIALIGLLFLAAPISSFAQNMDCTLIVPPAPLSAAGLATPYQLKATNPTNGPCDQANFNSRTFVHGVFIDWFTGQIGVYNPLVINAGTVAGVAPVVPDLPKGAIVSLYFGFNGNNLTLQFQGKDEADSHCVQGFGQEAWCNTAAFFTTAHDAIDDERLNIPALGTGNDGLPCPSTRSFRLVDQDQSDNVTTRYVKLANGLFASDTAANRAAAGATVFGNPSDNRLLDAFVDKALACTPWLVPDVQDGNNPVPTLPTNELQAGAHQAPPLALVPLGDEFTFSPPNTGTPDLKRVNIYRRNVDQPPADNKEDASTTAYCRRLRRIQTDNMLIKDHTQLLGIASPLPDVANNLFTFMAQRYVGSYQMLGCEALLGKPVNVTLTTDAQGVVIAAQVNNQ
jgi:hypothetical protein